jgi:hypothetical protein
MARKIYPTDLTNAEYNKDEVGIRNRRKALKKLTQLNV